MYSSCNGRRVWSIMTTPSLVHSMVSTIVGLIFQTTIWLWCWPPGRDGRAKPTMRRVSRQVEDFLAHGKALALLLAGHRLKQPAHELLPTLIHRILVQLVPRVREILTPQHQSQILSATEDRIIRDPDLFQLGQQLRPDARVLPFILLNTIGLNPQVECVPRNIRAN